MTIVHNTYEFVIQEEVVYKIKPTNITNIAPSIHITGSGSVNLRGSIQIPSSVDDPILTLEPLDSNLFGFYHFVEGYPNFIKLEPSDAGVRVITLSGFLQPEEIFFV